MDRATTTKKKSQVIRNICKKNALDKSRTRKSGVNTDFYSQEVKD